MHALQPIIIEYYPRPWYTYMYVYIFIYLYTQQPCTGIMLAFSQSHSHTHTVTHTYTHTHSHTASFLPRPPSSKKAVTMPTGSTAIEICTEDGANTEHISAQMMSTPNSLARYRGLAPERVIAPWLDDEERVWMHVLIGFRRSTWSLGRSWSLWTLLYKSRHV